MADVWANYMACHPRATCHIAGCKIYIRHIENSFFAKFHFSFFNAVWALTSGGFRIVADTLVIKASGIYCRHLANKAVYIMNVIMY